MIRNLRWASAIVGVVFFTVSSLAFAQGTLADYNRANLMPGVVKGKVFKDGVEPHWLTGNTQFWYRNELARGGREFILVDALRGTRTPAFDHGRLASALSGKTGKKFQPSHLPLTELRFPSGKNLICFKIADKCWCWNDATAELKEDKGPEGNSDFQNGLNSGKETTPSGQPPQSPDGRWIAWIKENNIFLRSKDSVEEIALSNDGKPNDSYEEPILWSQDSRKLVALRTQTPRERQIHLVESSPQDQVQPRLHSLGYRKPGDPIPISKPHLFEVGSRKEIPIKDELFPNPWSLTLLQWDADSSRFLFLYNQRGHQVIRVIGIDATTGKAEAIVDEQSKTFIDYNSKLFIQIFARTHELIWMSEHDGWNHLYLVDTRTGKVKNQITHGQWVVRRVDRVDEEKRQIWFQAGGIYPDQDPYQIHFCRANFDGSGLVKLTDGDGTHSIHYSPDQRFFIDTWSRVDLPPVTELRRGEDGQKVCELERADTTALLATGWKAPERFVTKGRDAKTDIYGVIYRPSSFNPAKKYPVIESIYAGPQGSFVPKRFEAFYPAQPLAELGFIVVQIDGMGTSDRSKAFHDVCWKNLGDAGFPDRILWIKAAANKYSCFDLDRIGIYGVSAGGQSALAGMLAYPDFYKVGVAACGCHDNRMDKIWWNELWMGWPVGPQYAEQSNVTNSYKLKGKLLLIVGELDRNVDPASTMQVVNALIKADKDFDLLVVPGADHGWGGGYGMRRLQDFFVRHLLGVEPRVAPK